MKSLVQIMKINEPRTGKTAGGYEWVMQDCEAALLNEADGSIDKVGVLMLPKDQSADKAPLLGQYSATFAMIAEAKTRKLVAVITNLTPLPSNFFKHNTPVVASVKAV
jgi:hypothetical protein